MDLEHAEVAAWADLYRAVPPGIVAEFGVRIEERDGILCAGVAALPESRLLNHVFGLGKTRPATGTDLDALAAFYESLGCDYWIALSPSAQPPDLETRLAARGFVPDYAWVKFRRGVEPLADVETDLDVVEIGPERATDFGHVIATAFELPSGLDAWVAALVGRPRWRCFLATAGSEPAGAGALYVAGESGWLGFGATMPEHRRRGAQSAVFAARFRAAADAGCTTLVTETGELVEGKPSNSYRNILRVGFEPVFTRPNYRAPVRDG